MRLLTRARCAMASTRAPLRPLAVNSAVAASRIAARVRSGSRVTAARRAAGLLLVCSIVTMAIFAALGAFPRRISRAHSRLARRLLHGVANTGKSVLYRRGQIRQTADEEHL